MSEKLTLERSEMTRFLIFPDNAGEYRWTLYAANHERVATSEGYVTKQGAINSAYAVKRIAGMADVVVTSTSR